MTTNIQNKGPTVKLGTLENLFVHELKDLLSAERQLVKALPKMAKGANSPALQAAFEEHLEQTKGHVERLEKIFRSSRSRPARSTAKRSRGWFKREPTC